MEPWWLLRAREMTPREVPHRVREAVRRRGAAAWRPPIAPEGPLPRWPVELILDDAARAAIAEGVRQVRGGFPALGTRISPAARTAWHTDPATGHRWPEKPAFQVDLRAVDPKPTWELHRLQHLALLAMGGQEAASAAVRELLDWIEHNAPGRGIGWASGLEVACRAVSILRICDVLRGRAEPGVAVRIRASLAAHGAWLERHPSLYSSANNHRLAEAVALVLLGATTGLPQAERWLDVGRRAVLAVLPTLVLADGVGGEMSVAYEAFALEWALLARAAVPLGPALDERLALGAGHLCALLDSGGNAPAIGDDDDGVVLRQGWPERRHPCSVAGAVGAALGRPDLVPAVWRPDLRARLLGAPSCTGRASARGRTFPVGGLTVLASRRVRVTVDHGPLGWPALAAHGHADALAVWLHVDGRPVLVGRGTYRYRGAPGWRRWLRGTGAHNTVVVDGLDSSEPRRDPFLWRSRARARLLAVHLGARGGQVLAEHDGYRRLGVVHRRRVHLDGDLLVIEDDLAGEGRHRVGLPLHLAPDLHVGPSDTGWVVTGRELRVEIAASLPGEVLVGGARPGPGLHAPRYGELEPAPTLWLDAEVQLPWRHRLEVRVVRAPEP